MNSVKRIINTRGMSAEQERVIVIEMNGDRSKCIDVTAWMRITLLSSGAGKGIRCTDKPILSECHLTKNL